MTILELITKANDEGSVRYQMLNSSLMEVSKSNKRRPGFIKVAVDDTRAANLMSPNSSVGMMIFIDRDVYKRLVGEAVITTLEGQGGTGE